MTNADANRAAIRSVKETTAGTTPATPAMQENRITGESLNSNRDSTTSAELRSDRQIADHITTGEVNEGDLNIEWSFSTHNEFLAGALQDAFSTLLTYSETDCAVTGSVDAMQIDDASSSFPTADLAVGQWIAVAGFTTNAVNNGTFRILTHDADTIVFDRKFGVDTFTSITEGAGDTITLKGQYLKNGTTRSSYTIEKEFADLAANNFFTFLGMEIGTMSLAAEVGSALTGAFGFTGRSSALSSTTVADSNVAATSTTVFNAVDNLGQFRVDNSLFTDGMLAVGLELNNNPRPQPKIGSFELDGIGMGTLEVTGTGQAYFTGSGDSQNIYDDFTNSTSGSMEMAFQDTAGNVLMFVMPNIKYSNMVVQAEGINTDVVMDFEYTAIRDATSDSTIQVHSIPA